jgi:hypothetical protein
MNAAGRVDPNVLLHEDRVRPVRHWCARKDAHGAPLTVADRVVAGAVQRGQFLSDAAAAVTMSANRTAYPSTAEFVKGGSAIEAMRS